MKRRNHTPERASSRLEALHVYADARTRSQCSLDHRRERVNPRRAHRRDDHRLDGHCRALIDPIDLGTTLFGRSEIVDSSQRSYTPCSERQTADSAREHIPVREHHRSTARHRYQQCQTNPRTERQRCYHRNEELGRREFSTAQRGDKHHDDEHDRERVDGRSQPCPEHRVDDDRDGTGAGSDEELGRGKLPK